ncbi:MAG: phosphatase PAP2 family protein [Sphingomonadales bacterium]|nr:phosphatase PAP2 family protein [Sphingomonadales bacterium]
MAELSAEQRHSAPAAPAHHPLARRMAWALLASTVAILVLMVRNRLPVDPVNWAFGALAAAMLGFALVRHRTHGAETVWQTRWRDFSELGLLMIVICVLGAIGSYEAASATSGFYDAALEDVDRMLHFDWLALYLLVVRHPVLQWLGAAAYDSVFVSPWVLIGWMAWHGQREQAYRFLLVFWLSTVLTLVLFPLFPARGALAFLWHGPIHYMPTNGLYQGQIIPALRDHAITRIEFDAVRGLVCAPSFHTVCAVLYIATAWPIAALRRWLVPLNLVMLLAVPVEGTHYLVDMILGALVAVSAIVVAGARWPASPPWLRAAAAR